MIRDDFGAIILTHGRPDGVVTDKTLRRAGYSGPIWYLVDNEDKAADRYRERYGDRVIVFDKRRYADMVDEGDNFDDRRTTTHARNAMFDVAESLGLKWFIQLDDDYTDFTYRTNASQQYPRDHWTIRKLDMVFEAIVKFMGDAPQILTVAMSQGGDFIGGGQSLYARRPRMLRKAMNSFFCSTERRFWFRSRMNEDVNTYLRLGFVGGVLCTIPFCSLTQNQTQSTASGMTDVYRQFGTYVKSFYSVMYHPSAAKVSIMHSAYARIHHKINWKKAVPQIVSESQRRLA